MKTDDCRISGKKALSIFLAVFLSIFMMVAGISFASNNTKIEGDVYEISVHTIQEKNNKVLAIKVLPKEGVHCNLEYPWKLKVTETKKISFAKEQFGRSDASAFTEKKVEFRLPVTSKMVTGSAIFELKLSMCNDKQCFMKKVPISYTLR